MNNPRFTAAFFDLDGTLIDTGPPHLEAERATVQSFGFDDLAEDHPVTFGQGVKPGAQMVADHYGLPDAEAVLNEYLNQWKRIAAAGIDLLPGADATVRSVAATGMRVWRGAWRAWQSAISMPPQPNLLPRGEGIKG